jgi:hypothetical protein
MVSKRSRRRGDIPRIPTKKEMLGDLNRLFKEKFGREPGPDDPLFLDPDADTPIPLAASKLRAQVVITMIRAGTPEIRAEWDFAMQEYDRIRDST